MGWMQNYIAFIVIYRIFLGGRDHILLSEYQENGEWELTATKTENKFYSYESKTVTFPYVR